MNVKEVYNQLLKLDESIQIEVKQGSEIGRSVMKPFVRSQMSLALSRDTSSWASARIQMAAIMFQAWTNLTESK